MSNYVLPDQNDLDTASYAPARNPNTTPRPNRPNRPLVDLRFDWYRRPFARARLSVTTDEKTNHLLILPGHRDSTLDRRTSWFMNVPFVRLKEPWTNRDNETFYDMVEIPSLSIWGQTDPFAIVRQYFWDKSKKQPEIKPSFKWILQQHRYIFLVASAEEEYQMSQAAPLVLELPGSYRDGKPDTKYSAGYQLATLPSIRENVKASPRYGQLKYGIICNPDDMPIIEVERNGQGLETSYNPKVTEYRTTLKNRALLEQLVPIETIINKPSLELIHKILRFKVSEEDLRACYPAALEQTPVTISDTAPNATVQPQTTTTAPAAVSTPAPKPTPVPAAAPSVPVTPVAPVAEKPAIQAKVESAPVKPAAVETPAAPAPEPVVQKPVETPAAPAATATTAPDSERVVFHLPKQPMALVKLMKSLKANETKLITDCDKDGSQLMAALQAGDPERLAMWMEYAEVIPAAA